MRNEEAYDAKNTARNGARGEAGLATYIMSATTIHHDDGHRHTFDRIRGKKAMRVSQFSSMPHYRPHHVRF